MKNLAALKSKVFHISSQFKKDAILPSAGDPIDSIHIEGYANTISKDRSGDVIPLVAWEKGVENYLKNPIILAYHDHDEPIGRMVEHKITEKGLWIKARISAAAEDVFNLIKDGILTAFSVGFYIKDATYDAATDLFIIKELELIEISVVSVPCNQDSLFSLAKQFGSADDYAEFKSQFNAPEGNVHKNATPGGATFPTQQRNSLNMDPKELEALLAKTAAEAAEKALRDAEAAKVAAEKAAAEKAAEEKRVADLVAAQVKTLNTGAESLLAEVEKRFAAAEEASSKTIADLRSEISAKAQELAAVQTSRMQFSEKGAIDADITQKETAILLSTIMKRGVTDTAYGKALVEKLGAHQPTAIDRWETEVSLNMEQAIRAKLVVANAFRSIDMKTNVMKLPLNPEAGLATWIQNNQFGTAASAGSTQVHQLQEVTLSSYKVATQESLAFEEEEDSLIVLLPIIRDGMIRRIARAIDRAYLRGAGTASDPITGVAMYDATSAVTATNTGVATVANMRALRQDLGIYGLDPADVIYIVSTEVYYNLLDDTQFQTMNQVGPQATLLTGQIGQIGNSPVLVSAEFGTKAAGTASASTNIGAVAIAPRNFVAGNQRGLRFDTQDLAFEQRKVLVASMRTGLTQLSTAAGPGVSALRWL